MAQSLLKEQSQLLLIKQESVYGIDSSPDGSNALLVRNIDIKPEFDKADRNNVSGMLGAQGAITVGQKVNVSFELELVGSGAAGTVPSFSPVLRSCGLAETITAATSVDYTPVGSAFESMTAYWRVGSLQHSVMGIRGSISLELSTGGIPIAKFTGIGLYNAPVADVAAPVGVDMSGAQSPIGVYKDTVTEFVFFGDALQMKSLSFDIANEVNYSNLVNSESVDISGRNSSISTGFRLTEDQYVAYMNKAKTDAAGAMSYKLGSTAGKIFELAVPNAQIKTSPTVSWDQSLGSMSIDAAIVPLTANSDFTLTFK